MTLYDEYFGESAEERAAAIAQAEADKRAPAERRERIAESFATALEPLIDDLTPDIPDTAATASTGPASAAGGAAEGTDAETAELIAAGIIQETK